MDTNYALWIAGGPAREAPNAQRDREQLHAVRESKRHGQPSLIDRIRGISRTRDDELDLVCCPA